MVIWSTVAGQWHADSALRTDEGSEGDVDVVLFSIAVKWARSFS